MPNIDTTNLFRLRAIVGPERLLTDEDSLQRCGRDWTRVYAPSPSAVLLPGDVGEVQEIVRLAAPKGIAIVPSGGRTGLKRAG